MIKLRQDDYWRLIEPLKTVAINNLFARSVVEKQIDGSVYVDNKKDPQTYYVVHPYGMSLLFGSWENAEFNSQFLNYVLKIRKTGNKTEWMQAFPDNWAKVLEALFQNPMLGTNSKIELDTRLNFVLNREKFDAIKESGKEPGLEIVRTDKSMFLEMQGSVVPHYFWKDADDFYKNSLGYSTRVNGKLASTAFAGIILDNKLEIGIETFPQFQGRGCAKLACIALIDYCLKNNFEPVWACKLSNVISYKLAQRLGFDLTFQVPFYKLGL